METLWIQALLQTITQRLDLHQQVWFVQLADGQPVDSSRKTLWGQERYQESKRSPTIKQHAAESESDLRKDY